jgi:hypothetical protein
MIVIERILSTVGCYVELCDGQCSSWGEAHTGSSQCPSQIRLSRRFKEREYFFFPSSIPPLIAFHLAWQKMVKGITME